MTVELVNTETEILSVRDEGETLSILYSPKLVEEKQEVTMYMDEAKELVEMLENNRYGDLYNTLSTKITVRRGFADTLLIEQIIVDEDLYDTVRIKAEHRALFTAQVKQVVEANKEA